MTAMSRVPKSGQLTKNQKKKLKANKKVKKEFKSPDKRGRLIIRNLPFKCNENEVKKYFQSFGAIREIELLRRPDKKLVGCGFVEFVSRLSADRAVQQLNGKPFLGRPIYIEKAVARDRYGELSNNAKDSSEKEEESNSDSIKQEFNDDDIKKESSDEEDCLLQKEEIKEEELSSGDEDQTEDANPSVQKSRSTETETKDVRKARLIVRNLSFKTTEKKLKDHFSQFGEVTEVKLLRRANNTLVGCGFVQFSKKQSAAKAIHHTSGKPFLDRPIIVDWAVPKDKFKKIQEEAVTKEIKKEDASDEESKPIDTSCVSVKKESSDEETEFEEDSTDSDEDENEDEDDDDDDTKDVKPVIKEEPDEIKNRKSDVDEGKTVFVKQVPFSASDEEFRECMQQFGPVYYALVCKDKLTERSKGSGFVKFKKKEDAEKCLSAGTELTLKGNILDPHPALKRSEAQQLSEKAKEKKDNRNLYLVREGLIMAGTPAAKGVSVSDMDHRLQLEQWKTTKLRNLNMFVSRNRLVVHNLPQTLSDKQLRKLFQRHTSRSAVIKEARVMRDLKHVDDKGQGISKGYGFVSFEKHEDALMALRKINNNPDIFSPTARPIVSFSIENRAVLNIKQKRLERSRQKNPLCKEYKPDDDDEIPAKRAKQDIKHEEDIEPQFAGIAAKPGAVTKMRKSHKLKFQAQQHLQDVKEQKRAIKTTRKIRRAEHLKKKQTEKKSTKHKKTNDETFTKLVDKYKSKLMSQSKEKKKWYDE